MEKELFDAATQDDTATLSQLLQKQPNILDSTNLKCDDKNALHIGAMLGHERFVQAILQSNSSQQMCLARDHDGRNPVHLAAVYGKLNIFNLMIQCHQELMIKAALEETDGGGTICHLCIKYNQLDVLKFLLQIFRDPEFLSAKNQTGMTILHLAIYYNQNQGRREIIMYLIDNFPLLVNIKNANGKTALDLILEQGGIAPNKFTKVMNQKHQLNHLLWQGKTDVEILQSLAKAQALTGRKASSPQERLSKKREHFRKRTDGIMVVASLIGTMAFQSMVTPPGGVWQDSVREGPDQHTVGEAVMAYTHPYSFRQLIRANAVAFVSSLCTIIVLLRGSHTSRVQFVNPLFWLMWLSIAATTVTYGIALVTVAPKSERGKLSSASEVVIILVAVCGFPAGFWTYRLYFTVRKWIRRSKRKPTFVFDPAPAPAV